MTGVSLCITPAKAQFNTVAVTPTRYKMEVLDMGLDQAEPASESEISVQEVSTGIPVSADMDKKKWMDRYLSCLLYTSDITAEEIKNTFQGIATAQATLLGLFREHNEMCIRDRSCPASGC